MDTYTKFSLFLNILGIVLYLVDYASDIAVAVLLSKEQNNSMYLGLTIALVVAPLAIVNVFSLVWFNLDHLSNHHGFCPRRERFKNRERLLLIISHALCLGPVVRQAHIIWCGVRERRAADVKVFQTDVL